MIRCFFWFFDLSFSSVRLFEWILAGNQFIYFGCCHLIFHQYVNEFWLLHTSSSSSIVGFESISMDFDVVNDDACACEFILCDITASIDGTVQVGREGNRSVGSASVETGSVQISRWWLKFNHNAPATIIK